MLEFQLFRIKVYPSEQMRFDGPQKPSEILLETIKSLPSAELWRGMIWHIGNIYEIDGNGLYFRVGRTTKAKREIYQEGNFIDEEFEEAPYTHVVLDIPTEVCAIAKKPKLSPSPKGIANQLIRLLTGSETAQYCGAIFEIDRLKDPEDLITHLNRAHGISRFSMTFSRPNPFDVEEDIVRPFSKLINEAQGEKGKAQIDGENLKPQLLEKLARSAAATGNDATARLRLDKEQEPTTIHLRENPVFVRHEDVSESKQKRTLLDKVRRVYRQVRGKLSSG
jgi:hypothetical protein